MPHSKRSRFMRWNSRLYSELFLPVRNIRERFSPRRGMSILFSPHADWEPNLRAGFEGTRHDIHFGGISRDSPARHDLAVPLTISALREMCAMRDHFTDNPIPIPRLECVDLCDDKYRFNKAMVERGFGNYIPQMGGDHVYPYMLKKRVDEWGKTCHIIRGEPDESERAALFVDPGFFTQQLVQGAIEYATHIVFKDHRIVCAMNIEYRFETRTPVKGRDLYQYLRPCPCYHLDLFARILDSIGFEGLCCINYKLLHKLPMILEINPRFGGSLAPYFFTFIRHVS